MKVSVFILICSLDLSLIIYSLSRTGPKAGNKVIVEFEHAFWPADFGVFVRAVQSPKERGHLQTWVNIHRILSKPILSSFLTGQPAIKFEKLSDEEVEKSGTSLGFSNEAHQQRAC